MRQITQQQSTLITEYIYLDQDTTENFQLFVCYLYYLQNLLVDYVIYSEYKGFIHYISTMIYLVPIIVDYIFNIECILDLSLT
jgi:hypothetical protein